MVAAKKIDSKETVLRFIDAINLPLALIDPHTGMITYANNALEELLARPICQTLPDPVSDLFTRQCLPRIDAILEMCRKRGEAPSFSELELEVIRSSQRHVPVNADYSHIVIEGQNLTLMALHDLTPVKKLQEMREATLQELSRVSKLADIGVLAAGIAHELNNPLMIIHGYAENLELLIEDPASSKHDLRVQVGEILKASERMGRVIRQMTRIARHEDAKLQSVDLQDIASGVLRFMGHELRQSDIAADQEVTEPLIARCDPGQVEQIILNVLSNAKHALKTVDGPRKIRITGKNTSTGPELHIWNNGPEIPKAVQQRIMTPFFTTKDVGEGMGLGLAVSYGIMKAHGGNFTFVSKPTGTQFTLHFPTVPADYAEIIIPKNETEILVVDDEQPALDILAMKLSGFGFKVYKARHASDALETLRLKPQIRAVFTDIRMPGVDGVGLIRAITELVRPLPLLFVVTGYNVGQQMASELSQLGVKSILSKPINHAAFTNALVQIKDAMIKVA